MKTRFILASGVALLTLVATGVATAQTKGAKSAKDAVSKIAAAGKSGKLQDMLPYVNSQRRKVWANYLKVLEAQTAFENAADKKFGKKGKRQFDVSKVAKALSSLEFKKMANSGADAAVLKVWKTVQDAEGVENVLELTITASKGKNGWTLLLPMPGTTPSGQSETRAGPGGDEIAVEVIGKERAYTKAEIVVTGNLWDEYRKGFEKMTKKLTAGDFESRQKAYKDTNQRIAEIYTLFQPILKASRK